MDLSDEEIIVRVQSGERTAYTLLFERYYTRVEGYARRQLRDAEAARDLASETFLRGFRSIDQFEANRGISYLGYLLMICRRLILTERSRRTTHPTQSIEECPETLRALVDMSELPLTLLLTSESQHVVQEALECLSSDDREIIHLAFERDLSRRDIGTIMGKASVSAVTSHLFRAMQRLKSIVILKGYFAIETDAHESDKNPAKPIRRGAEVKHGT